MILVLLGTQNRPFNRLLDAIEKQIKKGNIKEEVIVQAGHTKYSSANMKIFDLISNEEMLKLHENASLVITHGGVASIMECLKKDKIVIAAARLKKYGEHQNDHQLQIIEAFVNEGFILELKNFNKLNEVILKAKKFKAKKVISNTNEMVKLIEDYIDNV